MKKRDKREEENFAFLKGVSQLETIEFFGILRVLGVSINENSDFEILLRDLYNSFTRAPQKARKDILKILAATQSKEKSKEEVPK